MEAIKGAVQHGLGAAFVSAAAIEKEVAMGLVHRLPIKDVHLSRTISLVSHASQADDHLVSILHTCTAQDSEKEVAFGFARCLNWASQPCCKPAPSLSSIT